jgi:hypothetical protein
MYGSKLPDSYSLSVIPEVKCIYCKSYSGGMCDRFKSMVLPEYKCDHWETVNG